MPPLETPPVTENPPPTDENPWAFQEELWRLKRPPESTKSFVLRGQFSKEDIQSMLKEIDNPEVHRLALRYYGGGRLTVERAKYYCFFIQTLRINPHGKAILARPDIYPKYIEIAKRIYDFGHMRTVGDRIEPGDLDLDGDALTERIEHHLKADGIYDGIFGSYNRQKPSPRPEWAMKRKFDLGGGRTRRTKPKP